MTVSDLLEQPCNKSDNINKVVTTVTAICVQAQTANIFARLFTFETGRLPLETEMFQFLAQLSCFDVPPCTFQYFQAHNNTF